MIKLLVVVWMEMKCSLCVAERSSLNSSFFAQILTRHCFVHARFLIQFLTRHIVLFMLNFSNPGTTFVVAVLAYLVMGIFDRSAVDEEGLGAFSFPAGHGRSTS